MPPRKNDLQARVDHLDRQNTLLLMATHDLVTHVRPDAMEALETVAADPGHYYGTLFRAGAAHGGYVILTREWYSSVEKRTISASSVHYLDELGRECWPLDVRILGERLRVRRDRLLLVEAAPV